MLGTAVTIEEPKRDPIMLDDAKAFLRVDGAALDFEVALAVQAAREELEDSTGLRLVEQVVRVSADTFADLAHLTVGPVQAIRAIRYLDAAGSEQLLGADQYRLTGGPSDPSIVPAPRASLPTVGVRTAGITVDLVVGFGAFAHAVPARLRHALLALLRGKFEDRAVDVEPLLVNLRINA